MFLSFSFDTGPPSTVPTLPVCTLLYSLFKWLLLLAFPLPILLGILFIQMGHNLRTGWGSQQFSLILSAALCSHLHRYALLSCSPSILLCSVFLISQTPRLLSYQHPGNELADAEAKAAGPFPITETLLPSMDYIPATS